MISDEDKIMMETLYWKIDYVGDWASFNYRKAMQDAGYKNGEKLGGSFFPQLWPRNI